MPRLNEGDLARVKTQELDDSWPTMIEIVAYFGEGRRRRRSVEISAAQFFGSDGYGAPMGGDQLIHVVNQLRRLGPKR
jgi:hypothetical protein